MTPSAAGDDEAGVEVPPGVVGRESHHGEGHDALKQVAVTHHEEVTQSPDGAETAALRKPPDDEPRAERHQDGRVLGARAGSGEENGGLARLAKRGGKEQES